MRLGSKLPLCSSPHCSNFNVQSANYITTRISVEPGFWKPHRLGPKIMGLRFIFLENSEDITKKITFAFQAASRFFFFLFYSALEKQLIPSGNVTKRVAFVLKLLDQNVWGLFCQPRNISGWLLVAKGWTNRLFPPLQTDLKVQLPPLSASYHVL